MSQVINAVTPRLFIAATEQNTGKTTTAVGLYAELRKTFERIGFIKPVGQRFVDVEGKQIDETAYSSEIPSAHRCRSRT